MIFMVYCWKEASQTIIAISEDKIKASTVGTSGFVAGLNLDVKVKGAYLWNYMQATSTALHKRKQTMDGEKSSS